MLWAIGFLVTFLFGGLTGVILASPPLDFHVSDSYFVVAHFHYVVFGTVVFAMFAGFYFWWPKMTGKMLDERLGKIHFWTLFIGFHTTFLVQHWLGVEGMPRRYADYLASDGFTDAEHDLDDRRRSCSAPRRCRSSTTSTRPQARRRRSTVDDPWGYGRSLEWATSCPPPRHNFLELPRIRSERPAFDLHYPHVAALDTPTEHKNLLDQVYGEPDLEGGTGGERDEGRGLAVRSGLRSSSRCGGRLLACSRKEPAGTTALASPSGLAFLIGYYLLFTARRIDRAARGQQGRRDRRRRRRAGLLQPAQLVAAAGRVLRGHRPSSASSSAGGW